MAYFEVHGRQMHFVDQGAGDAVVIVHGTPTNSSEYRDVIGALSQKHRCVAIDHLGFGHSEKPAEGDYSIPAHRDRLTALLHHLNLKDFHLVVHDFGGVIALPLLSDDSFKVKSITVLNSWLWPLVKTEPQMKNQKWLVSTGILPFLYRHLNFSARFLIKMAWGKKRPLAKERHRTYIQEFPDKASRSGTLGFLVALFDFENPCWQQTEAIAKMAQTPVQIIWGRADKMISVRNLEKWKELLPQSQIHELENVGHFVAEEAPEEVAKFIAQWVGETK